MYILPDDQVTGMRDRERDSGGPLEVRCRFSVDARTATPAKLLYGTLEELASSILMSVPVVVSVTWNIVSKPLSAIEEV